MATTPPIQDIQPAQPECGSTLTRVMSPTQGLGTEHGALALLPVGIQLASGHASCDRCTYAVAEQLWVCSLCYAAGHRACLQPHVVEGFAFCADCTPWARQQATKMHHEAEKVKWKSRLQAQLEGWRSASTFATGTLGSIGLALGGATVVVAQASAALIRGAAAGAQAAGTAAAAEIEDQGDEGSKRSACPRAVDSEVNSDLKTDVEPPPQRPRSASVPL